MVKKVKKIIFPATTIAAFSYFSLLFGIGLILGYLVTKFFCDKFIETGKIKLVFIKFKKWEIHLHHWIMGALILGIFIFNGWLPLLPKVFIGAIVGVALHDFHIDREWYKIISKRAHSSVG